MRPPKLCFTQKCFLHLLFGVVFSVLIFLVLVHNVFGSLNQREAEEARIALERIGKVYVSADDILKVASEVDPATKLPYADTLSLLILASKAQRHLETKDYGKILGESAWFVGKRAVVNSYPFAAPFLMLGELYYSLFNKIAGIPQHFENAFFKFQINKYLSLRAAYDAKSVRDFALDSPLGLADDRAKGYFFSAGLGGSTSTQVNLALRLRDNGLTPEVIFELGEKLWDLQGRLSSIDRDRSVKDLAARIKEATRSKPTEAPPRQLAAEVLGKLTISIATPLFTKGKACDRGSKDSPIGELRKGVSVAVLDVLGKLEGRAGESGDQVMVIGIKTRDGHVGYICGAQNIEWVVDNDAAAFKSINFHLYDEWEGIPNAPIDEARHFEEFIRKYPKSKYAVRARFEAGRRYQTAAEWYEEPVDPRFPKDLKRAQIYRQKALTYFQNIIRDSAGSEWAKRAKRELSAITAAIAQSHRSNLRERDEGPQVAQKSEQQKTKEPRTSMLNKPEEKIPKQGASSATEKEGTKSVIAAAQHGRLRTRTQVDPETGVRFSFERKFSLGKERDPCDAFAGLFATVLGDVPNTIDLSDSSIAVSLLEKGKAYAFTQCRLNEQSLAVIDVVLYQPSFGAENPAVSGQYGWVTKPRFKLTRYRNELVEKKQREEERRRAEEAQSREAAERVRRLREAVAAAGPSASAFGWTVESIQNCDQETRVSLRKIGVPYVYIGVAATGTPRVDLGDDDIAKAILAAGKVVAERYCVALGNPQMDRGVDIRVVTGSSAKEVVTGRFRYGRESQDWQPTYHNRLAEEAERRAEAERSSIVNKAQQEWVEKFRSRHRVEEWLHSRDMQQAFGANPFPWKNRTVGFVGSFIQMLSENEALFKVGDSLHVVLEGLPRVRFTRPGQESLLGAVVQGVTQASLPRLGTVSVPKLAFKGVEDPVFPQGWLGAELGELSRELVLQVTGVMVKRVIQDGPAGKVGLRPNDVILSFNGKRVTSPGMIIHMIRMEKPNRTVSIRILRERKEMDFTVRLGRRLSS